MPISAVLNTAILSGGALIVCVLLILAIANRRRVQRLCAETPCFEGIVPKPASERFDDEKLATGPMTRLEEVQMADMAAGGATPPLEQVGHSDHPGAAERQRLKDRIAGYTAGERALEAMAESPEATAAAEAAVARVGSPGAALLAAVSRSASAVEVRALLLRGADPDASFLDRGALAVAARNCSHEVVKVLIDANATLDLKDGRGWTPLMHAIDAHTASTSREAVVTLLLDAGAAVDVWGIDQVTPLDLIQAREEQQRLGQAARPSSSTLGFYTSNADVANGRPPRKGLTTLLREKSCSHMLTTTVASSAAPLQI